MSRLRIYSVSEKAALWTRVFKGTLWCMDFSLLLLIAVCAVPLLFLINKIGDVHHNRAMDKIFSKRERLTKDAYYEQYYKDDDAVPKSIVTGVLDVLEAHLATDLSRLQPSDSFTSNLKYLYEMDDMAEVEIVMSLESDFEIKISDEEAQNMRRVDDIMRLVARKVAER